MRVWSTLRPISIGTYPKEYGVINIVNFDQRQMVPEINHMAFGYIDYEQDLPENEQRHYDLWPEVKTDPKLDKVAKLFAKRIKQHELYAANKILCKAYEKGLIEEEKQLIEAAKKYM